MSEIIQFPAATLADIPCEKILAGAAKQEFQFVFVMGRLANGETWLSGSTADLGAALVLVEQLKRRLIPDGAIK